MELSTMSTPRAVTIPAWHDKAACRCADPEIFFPETGRKDEAEAAKRICARCPVSAACSSWAIARGEIYGIWGGTTQRERLAMRRAAKNPERQAA